MVQTKTMMSQDHSILKLGYSLIYYDILFNIFKSKEVTHGWNGSYY